MVGFSLLGFFVYSVADSEHNQTESMKTLRYSQQGIFRLVIYGG